MKHRKRFVVSIILCIIVISMTGCGKDYCSYGGCMREATSSGRCSEHAGLPNNPYYGIPKDWY